jgi:hypothetical protein
MGTTAARNSVIRSSLVFMASSSEKKCQCRCQQRQPLSRSPFARFDFSQGLTEASPDPGSRFAFRERDIYKEFEGKLWSADLVEKIRALQKK